MRNTRLQYRALTFVVGELSHVEFEGDVHLVGEFDGCTLSPVGGNGRNKHACIQEGGWSL